MRPRRRRLIATVVALAIALGVVAAFALAGGFDKSTTERATGGGVKVVRVALVDATVGFDVTPDVVAVDPGTHLILDVMNDGDEVHDLAVDGRARRGLGCSSPANHSGSISVWSRRTSERCAPCRDTSSPG